MRRLCGPHYADPEVHEWFRAVGLEPREEDDE
jgi:hypothetical protein